MNEEQVIIPVGFEVQSEGLDKLRTEVDKILSASGKASKKRNISLIDSNKLKSDNAELSLLSGRIADIAKSIRDLSSNSLAKEFTEVDKNVTKYTKDIARVKEELKSAKGELGAYTNKHKQALAYQERMNAEIAEMKEIASSANRELTQEEKAKIAALTQEASLRVNMSKTEMDGARGSYEGLQQSLGIYQEMYEQSVARKNELSDIIDDEQKIAEYDEKNNQDLIKKQEHLENIVELYKQIAREMLSILKDNGVEVKDIDADLFSPKSDVQDDKFATLEKLSQAEKNLASSTKQESDAQKEETQTTKQSTANFYYKLRAIKMLGFVFNGAFNAVDKFGKKSLDVARKTAVAYAKLLPGVGLFRLATLRAANSQKKFSTSLKSTRRDVRSSTKDFKSATKAHDGFNFSLRKAIKSILAYGLGIRSLYVLFRRLRKVMTEGIGEMSQQFADVNARMSSILTSINYMKAALTTIIEPLITIVAPILERISETVSNITYHVASFVAALSGQKNVYRAVKVQADYAESLDKTAKNAKKAKKELAGFDELNVLHSDDEDENEFTMGWELVPALQESLDLVDKLKDTLSKLFEPIKNAWNKMRDFVINSWKYAVERMKSLAGTIWDDFLKVWQESATQKIFEDIFKIVGDIGLIIGNLARNFEEAWKHNENGYRILAAIRDIIGIIIEGLRECADLTVEWSDKLSFIPLLDAIADVLQHQVVPALEKVKDLAVYLYDKIVLELGRYIVEELAPKLIRAFGDIVEAIGNIAENIHKALEENERVERIVAGFEALVNVIADGISECAEITKEWSKDLDFGPLFETFANVLNDQIAPAAEKVKDLFVYLYENVLLEIVRYATEELGPKLLQTFGNIAETVGVVAEKIKVALEENDRGQKIMSALEDIVGLVADKFVELSEKTKEWADTLDFSNLADSVLNFLENSKPLIQFIVDTVGKFWTDILLPFWKYIIETGGPALLDVLGGISDKIEDWDSLQTTVDNLFSAFEKLLELGWETVLQILEDIGDVIADFINSGKFDTLVDYFVKWVNEADPEELASKLEKFVIQFADLYVGLLLMSKIIMPVVTGIMTLMNAFNNTALLSAIGNLTTKVGALAGGAGTGAAGGGFAGLASSIGAIAVPVAIVVGVLATMVGAFGGLDETIKEVKERFDNVKESVSQFIEKIGFKDTLDNLKASFDRLKGSLETLRPIFEVLLDVLAGLVSTVLNTVIGAIDGLVLAFTGIIDIVSGVADIISGFVALLTGDHLTAMNKFEEGVGKVFLGIGETVAGVINGIAEALAGFIDLVLPGVSEGVGKFVTDVKNLFAWLKEQLIGDPIVYDIRDGVIGGFGEFISTTIQSIAGWVSDVVGKFNEIKDKVIEDVTLLKDAAVNKFVEIKSGISETATLVKESAVKRFSEMKDKLGENISTTKDNVIQGFTNLADGLKRQSTSASKDTQTQFTDMANKVKQTINEKTLNSSGNKFIQGLISGISSMRSNLLTQITGMSYDVINKCKATFNGTFLMSYGRNFINGLNAGINDRKPMLLSTVKTIISSIKTYFNSGINIRTLFEAGKDLLRGLASGVNAELPSVKAQIVSACAEIAAAARAALKIHSPSKVFAEIGKFTMEGMEVGIADEKDNVLKEFDDILPSDDVAKNFCSSFVESLISMKDQSIDIISDMSKQLDSMFSGLEFLSSVNAMYGTVNKLSTIKIPDIASGNILPATSEFIKSKSGTSEMTASAIAEAVKGAMIETLADMRYNNVDNQDIVVQIDGYEVFRAIRNQSDMFRNATGYGAL